MEKALDKLVSRRRLMAGAGAFLASSMVAPTFTGRVLANPVFYNNPFPLGVACGEPTSDGFVIWTRLTPDPFDLQAMPQAAIPVSWIVTADERMRQVVQSGAVMAHPEFAHAVHVEVHGLPADRPYWYRFAAGDVESPIGQARTTPLVGSPMNRLRFAFASCQHYEQGYYGTYRHMVADHPDLIIFLGDYIYENASGDPIRRHEGPEPRTLEQYRMRHALYKLDPDLRAAHEACPWIMTWDDHEVANDYAATYPADLSDPAAFLLRRAAAYQAYYEHMPLRRSAMPQSREMRLYQRYFFW